LKGGENFGESFVEDFFSADLDSGGTQSAIVEPGKLHCHFKTDTAQSGKVEKSQLQVF
jgi:hypothetical protein